MTPELRRGIDRIRDYLFGGGYPNPAQNAEQLSFLIYFYMYEAADAARVRTAQTAGRRALCRAPSRANGTCTIPATRGSPAQRRYRASCCAGRLGRTRSTASGW